MDQAERLMEKLQPYIESGPSEQGEYRLRCPFHGETSASASVNPYKESGTWYCFVCERGGSLRSLIRAVTKLPDDDPARKKSSRVGGFNMAGAKKTKVDPNAFETLSWAKVKGWHEHLLNDALRLERFMEARGLDLVTIQTFQIGFDSYNGRYTIPIFDESAEVANVRKYRLGRTRGAKVTNALGHGNPPRLFPMESLSAKRLLVTEGELDALVCIQHDIDAISGTGGAKKWLPEWSKFFEGKHVYFCYDNDRDGRIGAKKAARSVAKYAAAVYVMEPLSSVDKSDVTDWFLDGHTADELRARMEATESFETTTKPVKNNETQREEDTPVITVKQTNNSEHLRKPVSIEVTITGKKDPSYAVPRTVKLECSMNEGKRCETCPMLLDWEGEHLGEVDPRDGEKIAQFIGIRDTEMDAKLRSVFGINKCSRLSWDVTKEQTVEELFVMGQVDRAGTGKGADYSQRRVYNVGGSGQTTTNTSARFVGRTIPSPKDQHTEFMSWGMEETITSLDTFEMTPELAKRLSIFQTNDDPLDKCMEIANDLGTNITGIVGRERMHVAMDLVWHSALTFPFDGHVMKRGWLELLVVGDTRTGKTRIAEELNNHYQLGHFISCEGATFAGLVGGVNEVGNQRVVTWGEMTVNDRRLVVLDEVTGLNLGIIGNMSDIRTRGVAQITKIEKSITNARVRSIWIGNGRDTGPNPLGINVVRDVIGKDEDIARFDLAITVRKGDVDIDTINTPDRPHVDHVYTSDDCRDLILWVWSRRPDQIQWKPDAYREVYASATKLGRRYIEDPPLIQASNVREKIARLSVAFAARTFSTDDAAENIIVEKRHVIAAYDFMDKMYSYDNFGYRRVSKREFQNRAIAHEHHKEIKAWLRDSVRLLRFFLDRGEESFRSQDLEELTGLDRYHVNEVLTRLTDACMIRKVKSQIVMEPELRSILMEVEDARPKSRPGASRKGASVRSHSNEPNGRERKGKEKR